MRAIRLGETGLVAAARIVAVGRVETAGVRRLLGATPPERLLDLTGGRKRRAVVLLDSGHVILVALSVEQLHRRLAELERE